MQYTPYTLYYTLYSTQYSVYTICTVYTIHYAVCSMQYAQFADYTPNSIHYIQYKLDILRLLSVLSTSKPLFLASTMYNVQCKMYNVHTIYSLSFVSSFKEKI